MRGLILAIQFLTRIPIPVEVPFTAQSAGRSLFWFPWISYGIGALVGLMQQAFYYKNPQIAAFLALLAWVALSGGMHLEGLMDTADGFLANRDPESIRKIMKDAHIGSFGAVALVLLLGGKYAALSGVLFTPHILGLIAAVARMGMLTGMVWFPAARPKGLGHFFRRHANRGVYFVQWTLLAALLIATEGVRFLYFPLIGIAIACAISRWSRKKIGGLTGDVYGALMEVCECGLVLVYGLMR